jgi:putative component of toxin-antitoxin plasmid stabilization module
MTAPHGCEYAQTAAFTRFGVMLEACDFAAMVSDIIATLAGDAPVAMMLSRQELGREVWVVRIPDGPAVRVVYEPIAAMIVTVLPMGWRNHVSARIA